MSKKKLNGTALWYEITFRKQREELCRLRETADEETREKIDQTITYIDDLSRQEEEVPRISLEQYIDEEIGDFSLFVEYMSILEPISGDNEVYAPYKYFPVPQLSDDDFFAVVNDFFKDVLDKELYGVYRGMFKRHDKWVHMCRLMEKFPNPNAVFFPYGRKVPIRLKRSNTAEDLVSLSHEYGHGIQFRSNFHPDFFKFGNAFVEVISLFFELLSMEYFGKFPEFQESLHAYRIASFDNLATRGDMLLFEMDVLCIWEERDHSKAQRIKAMNEKIKARFGWNEKWILELFWI